MATVTWSQVQTSLLANAAKAKTLSAFVPANKTAAAVKDTVDAAGWTRTNIVPATPLSAVLTAQDILYQGNSESARRAMLRDETTDLQEKAMLHLKGRAWPVRRTAEGIAACGMEEARAWPELGWRAIAELRDCQIVVANYEAKTATFFPEDVRVWTSSREVIYIDHECRYIWTLQGAKLSAWCSEKEREGWTIAWPLADGSMEELKAAAAKSTEIMPLKPTKDVLRKRLGRAQSIQAIASMEN